MGIGDLITVLEHCKRLARVRELGVRMPLMVSVFANLMHVHLSGARMARFGALKMGIPGSSGGARERSGNQQRDQQGLHGV
jgi:hypothetical protein